MYASVCLHLSVCVSLWLSFCLYGLCASVCGFAREKKKELSLVLCVSVFFFCEVVVFFFCEVVARTGAGEGDREAEEHSISILYIHTEYIYI